MPKSSRRSTNKAARVAERRITAGAIRKRKGAPFPVMTAYDAAFGRLAEAAGIDVILVGDSLGMVMLGYDSTVYVELADMERHGSAVMRGTIRAHVVVDLPFGSYEESDEAAVSAASRLVKYGGASSVKLEGGVRVAERIAAIVRAGIPVMAHIGVLPQTAGIGEGFRRDVRRDALLADARAVEAAGAYAVVFEMVDAPIARDLTEMLTIPTIGIGSGPHCDGQVLVMHDALGLFPDPPPFARVFADVAKTAEAGFRAYADAVRTRSFPPE